MFSSFYHQCLLILSSSPLKLKQPTNMKGGPVIVSLRQPIEKEKGKCARIDLTYGKEIAIRVIKETRIEFC